MKKLISIFMIIALSLVLALNVGATEVIEPIDTEAPYVTDTESLTEAETVPDTEAESASETEETENGTAEDIPEVSETESEERVIPIDEFFLRLWNEYRDTLFAALSTVFSIIVAQAFKNMSVNGRKKDAAAKEKEKADRQAEAEFKQEIRDKLAQFENYDEIAKQQQKVLKDSQLDREVLVKVIKMQAGQINQLIEHSSLPQARKDQIYTGYRAQLREIERLEGGDDGEA